MTSQCPVCGRQIADPEDCVGQDSKPATGHLSIQAFSADEQDAAGTAYSLANCARPSVPPTPATDTTSGAYSKYPVIDCMVQALVK